jgi:hypothetical protein
VHPLAQLLVDKEKREWRIDKGVRVVRAAMAAREQAPPELECWAQVSAARRARRVPVDLG